MALPNRHSPKLQKVGRDGQARVTATTDSFESHHKVASSPVIHVRGLPEVTTEADLVEALQTFGPISNILLMHKARQALVEFESLTDAHTCVSASREVPAYIANEKVYIGFSSTRSISRLSPERHEDPHSPNHILLFTVQKPIYPITTEVMHAVCSPCGPVHRIVIVRKKGVQAMVEFDSVQSAQKAKSTLHNAEIYSGCCTLKVEYSKTSRLKVVKNDTVTWDYTNPHLSRQDNKTRPALLGDHPSTFSAMQYSPHLQGYAPGMLPGSCPNSVADPHRPGFYMPGHLPPPPCLPHSILPNSHGQMPPSCVLMIYGLYPSEFNCDRVFNLLCLFGNVEQVKFMRSKPGTVMVQMGDKYAVDRALTHLSNATIFGNKISLCVSKQPAIMPTPSSKLEDGIPSYKDFSGSKNNRFTTPEQAAKNRIQHPSRILHFFNAPPEITEEIFEKVCEEQKLTKFTACTLFLPKSDRSCSGLLEWESISQAMEAIVLLNHYPLKLQDQLMLRVPHFVYTHPLVPTSLECR
nr:PREDICTED: heterogeneous nuclear ribonucleoprotein L-like isoform X1 [Latimeria chalumnae]|eukprot:XP_006003520.1 PREDICTED: heterogeneous nuclear ribonucleoprotein L-like isoform X1 [Latimeria chalumnae]